MSEAWQVGRYLQIIFTPKAQLNDNIGEKSTEYCFVVCCLKSDESLLVNISLLVKFPISFSADLMYRVVRWCYVSYFGNQGPHVEQPCAAEWCIAQNLLTKSRSLCHGPNSSQAPTD